MGFTSTTLAVVVAWVFFRAETFEGAWVMISAMFGFDGFSLPESLASVGAVAPLVSLLDLSVGASVAQDIASIVAIPVFLGVTWWLPNACVYALELYDSEVTPDDAFEGPNARGTTVWIQRFMFAGGAALALSIQALAAPSEFIYFQF